MLNLKCNIEITRKDNKKIIFNTVNSIEVRTSMLNLTDTATLKVPKKLRWQGRSLSDFISRDDLLTIRAGYDEYDLQNLFKGYLTDIANDDLTTISADF